MESQAVPTKPKRVSRKKGDTVTSVTTVTTVAKEVGGTDTKTEKAEPKKRKEKVVVNDIERRIKSLRKKAISQSASIERLYIVQDEKDSNGELTFDNRVDEEFKKMVEYKDYIINYDRLSKLPTFPLHFKTQLVDDDITQVKTKTRTKKVSMATIPEETDDWKQDLRTMTIRNRMVRIDDDKGLVYSATYELIGSIEEFEMMDEETETTEIDENNNLNI